MEISPWITEAMIKKMEERRKAKTTNIKGYRRLNNKLRRETDRAKEVRIYGRDMQGNNGPSEERQVRSNVSKGTTINQSIYFI